MDRLDNIENYHWFEHVQLEMPVGSSHRHCHIVPDDLCADHRQRLALGGVHLPWHYGRSLLVLWEFQLAEPCPWSASKESDIVGDLHQTHCKSV